MGPYVECANDEEGFKNTGASEQCLESVVVKTVAAPLDFSFATIEEAKSLTKWNTEIAAKNLFPLYDVEELAAANTEDTVFEGRNKTYTTAKGKKVITFNSYLGLCSHVALKSFNKKEVQLFEITEDGEVKAWRDASGKIKGQFVTLDIGKRMDAMPDKPPYTPVKVTYKDFNQFENNGVVLRPGFFASDIDGVYDVVLDQVSASTTEIEFTATTGCAGGASKVKSLVAANIIVRDADGGVETVTFVPADPATGVYKVTGTGFANGFTVELNGVISQPEIKLEAPEPLTIEI